MSWRLFDAHARACSFARCARRDAIASGDRVWRRDRTRCGAPAFGAIVGGDISFRFVAPGLIDQLLRRANEGTPGPIDQL
eukprot:6296592-Pyramimonas_sp.AAC.1